MVTRNSNDWEIKTRTIFALVFPIERSVFIGKTTMKSLWKAYDHHYRERMRFTKPLFAKYKSDDLLPEMYRLEEIVGRDCDAFERCILWSKFFDDHDYELILGERMYRFTDDLDEDMQKKYTQLAANTSLENLCSKEKSLFPEFKKSKQKEQNAHENSPKNKRRIEITVSDSLYHHIKDAAEKHSLSMNRYIIECVNNGGVIELDTTFIKEYIRDIASFHYILSGVVSTILLSRKYFPADMERMYNLSQDVMQSNKEVMDRVTKLYRSVRRRKRPQ